MKTNLTLSEEPGMKRWIIDPDHTVATFSVRHMMVANVHGQFNTISGTIHFDPADSPHSSVEVTIDATAIYTGIPKRDEHLRSEDFLDAGNHPRITFRSTKAEHIGSNRFRVTGDLAIRGITRQITLEGEHFGPVKDPFEESGRSIGFVASAAVNREEYGMTWNVPMELGGLMVGKEVRITLEVEADLVT
jgi:polyisoprenoid-binding protein YceI